MIKLIATDIDGTITSDGGNTINPEYYEVIDRLLNKGIIFVGASGRQFRSIEHIFKPISKRILYITDGGGFVRSYDEIFAKNPINAEMLKEMIKDGRKVKDCEAMLCGNNICYAEKAETPMFKWVRDSYKFKIVECPDMVKLVEENPDDFVKYSLYHPNNAETLANEWYTPKWKDKVLIASAGIQWADSTSFTCNKGAAIKAIQNKFGIAPDECMVFGDNINDMEMLQSATHSFAVGNAREELKAVASQVCKPVSEDGVLQELKKL